MSIIIKKNADNLEVVSGNDRLERELRTFGKAEVELDGRTITVCKNGGQLVEMVLAGNDLQESTFSLVSSEVLVGSNKQLNK